MIGVLLVITGLVVFIWAYMQQPKFGKAPAGEHLEMIKKSPHYKDGAFQNLNATPALTEGASYLSVTRKFFFSSNKRSKPGTTLPSVKSDLKNLDPEKDVIVWFGHSSYFMQLSGKRILVDPVFSGNASPLSFTTRSFNGTDGYTDDDFPSIDYLFITHDHYDHLDYKTILAFRPKVDQVITGLGTGSHLVFWGYDKNKITELDWNKEAALGNGFLINTAPGRHFSGRRFKRNETLWTSFILTTPRKKIFIGGDSGYDTHFAAIGSQHGPFDLVILENGQYNESWKYIHMMPEEVVKAAHELKAKNLFPVHWSKFALSLHDWDEPINRVTAEGRKLNMPMMHPKIGAVTSLDDEMIVSDWWTEAR